MRSCATACRLHPAAVFCSCLFLLLMFIGFTFHTYRVCTFVCLPIITVIIIIIFFQKLYYISFPLVIIVPCAAYLFFFRQYFSQSTFPLRYVKAATTMLFSFFVVVALFVVTHHPLPLTGCSRLSNDKHTFHNRSTLICVHDCCTLWV